MYKVQLHLRFVDFPFSWKDVSFRGAHGLAAK